MKVLYTEQALESLNEALIFLINTQNLPNNKAEEILGKVVNTISLLDNHPYKGQKEEHLAHLSQGHRRLIVGHFKVIYKVEEMTILITDIFDSRQSPDKMKI